MTGAHRHCSCATNAAPYLRDGRLSALAAAGRAAYVRAMRTVSIVTLLLALACSGDESPTESPREQPASAEGSGAAEPNVEPEAPAGPDESAQPRAEAESYVLELSPAGEYRSGQLAQLTLSAQGQNGWHLNEDFGFNVRVAHVDALDLPKSDLTKDDAASFSEDGARVDVPLTPTAAGEHALSAEVEFAVCNPSSCVPVTQTVGLRLAVAN